MNSRLKVVLGLAVIFAIGIATGVLIAPHFQKHDHAKAFPAAEWIESTVADYRARLNLSTEEENQVRSSITTAAKEIIQVRSETQTKMQGIIETMNGRILPTLDATRQVTLQQWLEEKRTQMSKAKKPAQ